MKTAFLLFLVTLFLAGCVQIPPPQNVTWLAHKQQLEDLSDWTLTGKIAIITPQEKHSLNIYWQQAGDNFHITLTAFLGSTVLDVKKSAFSTEIIDSDGEHFVGEDSELLIEQLSGLVIPIDVLQQWIKGNPTGEFYQLNPNNQVVSLSAMDKKNAHWSIDYSDYRATQGINLPYKLQLKRADLRLKFAISKWEIKPIKE